MRIEQVMTRFPRTCRPDDTLGEAARIMLESDFGCLPVTRDDRLGRLVGMITDRDVCMAACTKGKALHEIRVGDVMTKDVYACNPRDPVGEAEAIMQEARVRRLPVIDEAERVIGLLSLADLAREAAWQAGLKHQQITQAEVAEVLAAVCRRPNVSRATSLAPARQAAPSA